jgi:hypothetical protein
MTQGPNPPQSNMRKELVHVVGGDLGANGPGALANWAERASIRALVANRYSLGERVKRQADFRGAVVKGVLGIQSLRL